MLPKSQSLNGSAAATLGVVFGAVALYGLTPAPDAPMALAPVVAAAQIQLGMRTLHAALLSAARTPSDSADAPYLLVTVFGPGTANSDMQMPAANTHWAIRKNEAKGATPLTLLNLAPGDSVRVLLTLLEGGLVTGTAETTTGKALTKLSCLSSLAPSTTVANRLRLSLIAYRFRLSLPLSLTASAQSNCR